MEPTKAQRTVAIVGRPNVGKSALFNRIAHKRIAIVHDQSGVTRDRIIREVSWSDQPFLLMDTGGIRIFDGAKETDSIEAAVRSQVDVALEDAAAVILVVDVQAGLHPADAEVARMIRKSGRACFIAVNKCDLPIHEKGLPEFHALSFPLFPVAAQHNIGVDALMAEVLKVLPPVDPQAAQLVKPLRVAVVGRPNAGKSSYINRLLNSDRVIVSSVAGTTRDCVDVPFTIGSGPTARNYVLVDTAGMRHVHKIDTSVERFSLFRSEEAIKECDVAVLVMDAEIGPTTQDKYIASIIQRESKGCVLIMNKWDIARANGITETKAEPNLRGLLPFLRHCPIVFMSAQEGYNVRNSIGVIDEVASHMLRTLPTGLLNRTLSAAMVKTNLPHINGRQLRFYYATQTGTNPMILRIFVNDARIVTRPFQDYIIRTIRESFDLSGTPVILQFRSRVESAETAVRPAGSARSATPDPDAAPKRRPKPKPQTRKRSGGVAKTRSNLTPKSRKPKR